MVVAELADPARLIDLITQYGVLGIVSSIFYLLFRQAQADLKASNEARFAEVKSLTEMIKGNTEAMVRFTETLADRVRATEANSAALLAQGQAIDGLRNTLMQLAHDNARDMATGFDRLLERLK